MKLELISTNEPLPENVLHFIEENFKGKTPQAVIADAIESYKKFEAGMGDIGKFRREYDDMGWVRKKWNERELLENTNSAVLKMCEMSDAQAKMQLLVLLVTAKLGQQQKLLADQQDQIKAQTERISRQQGQIEGHQGRLEEQNEHLLKQQKALDAQARQLKEDNDRLIETSEVLKALRSVGQKQHDKLVEQGGALSDLEKFYVQLKKSLQDLDDTESIQDGKIDKNAENIAANRRSLEALETETEKQDEQIAKNAEGIKANRQILEELSSLGKKLDGLVEKNFEDDQKRDLELARQFEKDKDHDKQIAELQSRLKAVSTGSKTAKIALVFALLSFLVSIACLVHLMR